MRQQAGGASGLAGRGCGKAPHPVFACPGTRLLPEHPWLTEAGTGGAWEDSSACLGAQLAMPGTATVRRQPRQYLLWELY